LRPATPHPRCCAPHLPLKGKAFCRLLQNKFCWRRMPVATGYTSSEVLRTPPSPQGEGFLLFAAKQVLLESIEPCLPLEGKVASETSRMRCSRRSGVIPLQAPIFPQSSAKYPRTHPGRNALSADSYTAAPSVPAPPEKRRAVHLLSAAHVRHAGSHPARSPVYSRRCKNRRYRGR